MLLFAPSCSTSRRESSSCWTYLSRLRSPHRSGWMGLALEGRAYAPDVLAAGKCPEAPRGPARTAAGGRARRL